MKQHQHHKEKSHTQTGTQNLDLAEGLLGLMKRAGLKTNRETYRHLAHLGTQKEEASPEEDVGGVGQLGGQAGVDGADTFGVEAGLADGASDVVGELARTGEVGGLDLGRHCLPHALGHVAHAHARRHRA